MMSEKRKEFEEEEEEREMVDHWSHEHPLSLVETRRGDTCYGCNRYFMSGEQAYGCSSKGCEYENLLHEECAAMARKMRHPLHPQHTLIQRRHAHPLLRCAICGFHIWSGLGYGCTTSGCEFFMHMRCTQRSYVVDAADEQPRSVVINHPSHPKHELSLSRSCSFKCDACGTTRRGNSYICIVCQYWIHEICASLPQTMKREDHHHSLSLSFQIPPEYIEFDYKCDVCNKSLMFKYWIYHCELCRYAVHIKCAFNKSPHTTTSYAMDEKMIRLPTNDVAEKQIRPFVIRQGGDIPPSIPHDDDEMVNVKYKFLHHKHQLTLISSSSSSSHDDQNQEEEEEEDDGKRSELICDGCITPIFSSSSSKYYYMSCSECRYYLHLACFHLPPHLPSLPLLHQQDHDLILQSCDRLKPWDVQFCVVCYYSTNGLFYACKKCSFIADVKCASLPDTIYHAAHPQHPLNFLSEEVNYLACAAYCGLFIRDWLYACDNCDFTMHARCAMLPASVKNRKWDKQHPLPLTYDANLNHPGEFYCDECEEYMNPKSWMYHCRHCDLSFHPDCLQTTSGWCRNIKLGMEYVISRAHSHTLTYQLLTTKRRCDICRQNNYGERGFLCASCNFFICLLNCGKNLLEGGRIQADVD